MQSITTVFRSMSFSIQLQTKNLESDENANRQPQA